MYQFEPNRNPVDQGALSAETGWEACLRYMREHDVDWAEQKGFFDSEVAE